MPCIACGLLGRKTASRHPQLHQNVFIVSDRNALRTESRANAIWERSGARFKGSRLASRWLTTVVRRAGSSKTGGWEAIRDTMKTEVDELERAGIAWEGDPPVAGSHRATHVVEDMVSYSVKVCQGLCDLGSNWQMNSRRAHDGHRAAMVGYLQRKSKNGRRSWLER